MGKEQEIVSYIERRRRKENDRPRTYIKNIGIQRRRKEKGHQKCWYVMKALDNQTKNLRRRVRRSVSQRDERSKKVV